MTQELCIEKYVCDESIACHSCDLLVYVPALDEGKRAQCPRCGNVLAARHKDAFNRILAFSLSAIIFLILANLFPFLSLKVQGQERVITLLQSIKLLADEGQTLLAICILLAIVIIPALFLAGVFYTLMAIKQGMMKGKKLFILRLVLMINPWAMGEIFIIGVLISLIKIVALADVILGLSFWGYVMFSVFMTATLLHFDKVQIWHWVERSGK